MLLLAHGIGVLFAGRLVYTGASRWADPRLGVVTATYARGRTASGEAVSVATGTRERHDKPRAAALITCLGFVVWALIGGAATAVAHGWLLNSTNFLSARPAPT